MKEIDISIEDGNIGDGVLRFNPIVAGKDSTRNIDIKNKLSYKLDLDISISGDISLEQKSSIEPNKLLTIPLKINPSKSRLKPITAKINIRLKYIVRWGIKNGEV